MNYQPQHPLEPGAHSTPNEARRKQELERGQAIVLIAFVMVGLIAMLGLSVDGGGILFLYRDARNATDAATLAAAYARCTNDNPDELYNAGWRTAADNGFDNNKTQNFVDIHNPPLDGVGAGDSDYINVQIRAFKPSYFIQIVYPEALWIETEATGFCRRPFDSSTVGAIFGLANVCSTGGPAVDLQGSEQDIEGDVFSNGSIEMTGSDMTVVGNMATVGDFDPPNFEGKVTVSPPGTTSDDASVRDNPFSWVDINDYRPGGVIFDALEALNPDQVHYKESSWIVNNVKQTGEVISGFYMVEGNVDLGQLVSDPSIGLTIVATGEISITSPETPLKYYEPILTLNDQDIPSIGFLFYSEFGEKPRCDNNNDAINFSSNIVTATGVMYAPNGGIEASFSGGWYMGALIGWRVSMRGADTDIIRRPDLFPPQPPRVSIAQ